MTSKTSATIIAIPRPSATQPTALLSELDSLAAGSFESRSILKTLLSSYFHWLGWWSYSYSNCWALPLGKYISWSAASSSQMDDGFAATV
jgi:hypothetical protein